MIVAHSTEPPMYLKQIEETNLTKIYQGMIKYVVILFTPEHVLFENKNEEELEKPLANELF